MIAARGGSRHSVCGLLFLLLVSGPPVACAQSSSDHSTGDPSTRVVYRKGLDLPLISVGAGLLIAGVLLDTDRRAVPLQGLDPAQIKLGIDRGVVGNHDANAADVSDALRNVSMAFPLVVRFASAPSGERWQSTGNVMLLYAEAVGLSEGIAMVTKKLVSRARPYTYLPAEELPGGDRYDPNRDYAFQSFPSGHATFAWCAASLGIVDHLITRPEAGWTENAAIAFSGTALATAVSGLRVEAGQHFPTDVIVGSAIGAACGVAVPLMHQHTAGAESGSDAWVATAVGVVAGIVSGFIVSNVVGSN